MYFTEEFAFRIQDMCTLIQFREKTLFVFGIFLIKFLITQGIVNYNYLMYHTQKYQILF